MATTTCEGCAESTDATYDGGYCEDCAIDNLETGSGTKIQPDVRYADQRAHDVFWQTAAERNAWGPT